MTFPELYRRVKKQEVPKMTIIGLDPGGTTGVSIFKNGDLWDTRQIPCFKTAGKNTTIDWTGLLKLFAEIDPDVVVMEDYRIYEHKLDCHANSGVTTLRVIGGIDLWCCVNGYPLYTQMACEHKGFCTDKKLQEWGYWEKGLRHARDAIRVVCYWLLFHKE